MGEAQGDRMERLMVADHGKTIADIALRRGPPHTSFAVGNNETAFQWVLTGQAPGMIIPVSGMIVTAPPTSTQCRFTYKAITTAKNAALKDWIITGHSWQGAC